MKQTVTVLLALLFIILSNPLVAENKQNGSSADTENFRDGVLPSTKIPRGGRLKLASGIEGHIINFGFSMGGSFALMDALSKEKAFIGGRGSFFLHVIIPRTKTFAIGIEGGVTYLIANPTKYQETLIASTRDGALASSKSSTVSVGNWMLPTAQLSFMGNFHPATRFNIQIKGNIGVVLAMVPPYKAEYYIKEIQADQTYAEVKHQFVYKNDMVLGLSATVGTKFLYALTDHVELGVGLDWSYFHFTYEKGWLAPTVKVDKVLTQFGAFDLNIGFAFSF
ncbi:MAG: hypothetical protein LBQ64_04940 [Bacteroidales bacterium]|jgi:hypothetical protein|nr:hypothetical protein [Bacteroidales bacterium]